MCNYITAPLERSAVNGSSKRVVHDQRDAVLVSNVSEFLDIEYINCRIGDGLTEDTLCIGTDELLS